MLSNVFVKSKFIGNDNEDVETLPLPALATPGAGDPAIADPVTGGAGSGVTTNPEPMADPAEPGKPANPARSVVPTTNPAGDSSIGAI